MSDHQYPSHVVEAVAREMIPYGLLTGDDLDAAHRVLNALCKADQPHTLSADEARTIWNQAIAIRRGSLEAMHELRLLLAQHAPEWNGKKR